MLIPDSEKNAVFPPALARTGLIRRLRAYQDSFSSILQKHPAHSTPSHLYRTEHVHVNLHPVPVLSGTHRPHPLPPASIPVVYPLRPHLLPPAELPPLPGNEAGDLLCPATTPICDGSGQDVG